MRGRSLIHGDLGLNLEAKESREIVTEKNKTLSYFIIKVDDENTGILIDIDGIAKFNLNIKTMYDEGLTTPLKHRPYLLTYDDTLNVYVVVFEPEIPIGFSELHISIVPAPSTTVTYAYEVGFVEDLERLDEKLENVSTLLERILAELRLGAKRGRG